MRLDHYKKRAVRKGIEFNLDSLWLTAELAKGRCAATGIKFVLEPNNPIINPYLPSVDRIDSSKGYTKDNCRLVINGFNNLKSDNTEKQLLEFCKGFVKRYEEVTK